MELSIEYLAQRHEFWKSEIAATGIWDSRKFGNVDFQIRKESKTYNGLFKRKRIKRNFKIVAKDIIIIYSDSNNFDLSFIDSVLVHEMIHQYIIQNGIKDSSSHGVVFKNFMQRINLAFRDKLHLCIRDKNPRAKREGPGEERFPLLLVYHKNKWYCCVINSNKIPYFDSLIKGFLKNGVTTRYQWMESNDLYFHNLRKCTKRLSGKLLKESELNEFLIKYNVKAPSFTLPKSEP